MIAICDPCSAGREFGSIGLRYQSGTPRHHYVCPDCGGELRGLKRGETYGMVLNAKPKPATAFSGPTRVA